MHTRTHMYKCTCAHTQNTHDCAHTHFLARKRARVPNLQLGQQLAEAQNQQDRMEARMEAAEQAAQKRLADEQEVAAQELAELQAQVCFQGCVARLYVDACVCLLRSVKV